MGQWMMWVGAVFLSMAMVLATVGLLSDGILPLFQFRAMSRLGATALFLLLLGTLLVLWCDLVLVLDTRRSRLVAHI
jgi:hypothetical protein